MISAPSHLLRLSGNKYIGAWISILVLTACAGPKPVAHKPTSPPPMPPKEEQVKMFDPSTGTYVLVPRNTVKMDTVRWTVDTQEPMVTDKVIEPDKPAKKNSFQISLLMPFSIAKDGEEDNFDGRVNRFLQYYGGVQLAMHEIDSTGYKVSIHTYDVDGTIAQTERVLRDSSINNADVIVGPYDRELIEAVATFGMKNETMVISPWLPAFSLAGENPFFVQVTPGLSSHADAITAYIADTWPNKKVFLVARDNAGEINRLNLFKKNTQLQTEDLIINDDSPELAKTDLQKLLRDEGTIFILPYYAKADEGFVNSFLRKLHADKELKEVTVFGLPQWLSYSNINPNYMESLSVHISVSTYIDPHHEAYATFKQKYFDQFHTIPDLQAFLGYDLIKWLSNALVTSGSFGMIGNSSVWLSGIASGFNIKPVYKSGSAPSTSEMNTPLYYENTHIRILKYEGQDFHPVE